MKQHPKDAERVTKMYEQNGIFCFDLWLRHGDNEKTAGEDLGAVGAGSRFPRQAKGPKDRREKRTSSRMVRRTAWMSKGPQRS